jgi:hypothetical protein
MKANGRCTRWRPLAVFVRDEAQIVAGLAGETYCGEHSRGGQLGR